MASNWQGACGSVLSVGEDPGEDPRGRHGQIAETYPRRSMKRVRDGGKWRTDWYFSYPAHAVGMLRIRHFHDDRFDHRHVVASGDAVIQVGRVPHRALIVVPILLV